jgi:acyl carrier protein
MVNEKVRKIFSAQRRVNEDKITESTRITEDFGADPLDMIELIMAVEAEFSLEIPDNAVRRFKTVGDVIKYIQGRYN